MYEPTNHCVICDIDISHKNVRAKTCGPKCRQRYKRWKRARAGYDARYHTKLSRTEYLDQQHNLAAENRRRKAIEREEQRAAKRERNLVVTEARRARREAARQRRAAKTERAVAMGLSLQQYGQLENRYRQYGWTPERYVDELRLQGGTCANRLCGREILGFSGCVDHCHATGETRHILCNHCNKALGIVHESAGRLQGLIDYLAPNYDAYAPRFNQRRV